MKKLLEVLTIIILSGIVCILGYKKDITKIPNYYYQVYLDDEVLGVILQYRMEENLPTFFTSNLSLKELEDHLTISNNDR